MHRPMRSGAWRLMGVTYRALLPPFCSRVPFRWLLRRSGFDGASFGGMRANDRRMNGPGMPPGAPIWWDLGCHPHVECRHIQHSCVQLAESLPKHVAERMAAELQALPPPRRHAVKEQRVNTYLDPGKGPACRRIRKWPPWGMKACFIQPTTCRPTTRPPAPERHALYRTARAASARGPSRSA